MAHLEVHHVVHWADGGRTELGHLEDTDPDPDLESEPGGQDELWPGVAPPVPYQGATGEVLHGTWVTFHEGPALLL